MPGQQVGDVGRGGAQGAGELGDGEVAAGHGLVELVGGDAVRVRPREHEIVQLAGGQPGCPSDGFVDAVLVEEHACGVGEQFGLGGQDPPAKALVVLALSVGGGRDVGVGEVRGRSGQGLEEPALGVRGIGTGGSSAAAAGDPSSSAGR
ncbi:hypothetical protein [Streptomyces pseudovenezuelae]|uniref:hypothetical protein n=1 Tax=Streptomyces pseudovenezuelae TaxID=67350 RepID=UPI00247383F8|nr:hypothetical protein [Streptomyces pseudovenezuelae]